MNTSKLLPFFIGAVLGWSIGTAVGTIINLSDNVDRLEQTVTTTNATVHLLVKQKVNYEVQRKYLEQRMLTYKQNAIDGWKEAEHWRLQMEASTRLKLAQEESKRNEIK